jgi:chorismate synthase
LIRGVPCPATRSARCSASLPSANRTDPAIGCVVDGCPPGLALETADIQRELDRRKPGTSRHVTQRRESDTVEILSGVFKGRPPDTDRAPHSATRMRAARITRRSPTRSAPATPTTPYWQKYGIRDYRGGGRASARETAVRVAAGAIARKWLAERHGVRIRGHLVQLGPTPIPFEDWSQVDANPFFVANAGIVPKLEAFMDALRKSGDSCGAKITVVATGVPPGWGEPVYGRLDADLAQAMMGINAVKGVEIGSGFASVTQRGSEHSDEMTPQGFLSNNAGGILGGISTGQDVVVTLAVKPTSSIRLDRRSIDKAGHPVTMNTHGRHDPCVGIRAHTDRRSDAGARVDGSCAAPSRAKTPT